MILKISLLVSTAKQHNILLSMFIFSSVLLWIASHTKSVCILILNIIFSSSSETEKLHKDF